MRIEVDQPAEVVIKIHTNSQYLRMDVEDAIDVKPGMTANMSILVSAKPAVLSVPQRSIIEKDSKKYVRIITDAKKQTYRETEVTTGLEADGGLVEVVSGLSEGQTIVIFIETKK